MPPKKNVEILLAKRKHAFTSIKMLHELATQIEQGKSDIIGQFKARYKSITDIKTEFYNSSYKLNSTPNNKRTTTESMNNFDDLYYFVEEVFDKITTQNSAAVPQQTQSRNIKLPELRVPTFDGDIANWQTFKDNFENLIHNNTSLSDIEKFQYLVASLKEKALSLIKGIQLTDSNYLVAYNSLKNRFDNKRLLAARYLDNILNRTPNFKNSESELTELTYALAENINALEALNLESLQEFLLFSITVRTLDKKTKTEFEDQNTKEFPTYQDLIQFLLKKIKTIEVCRSSECPKVRTQPEMRQKNSSHLGTSTQPQINKSRETPRLLCPICQNRTHNIYKCEVFQNNPVPWRREVVERHQLCLNCLRPKHETEDCPSKGRCLVCGGSHNTLLHSEAQSLSATLCSNLGLSTNKLLGTAIVQISDQSGTVQPARALIDSGSMDSFITLSCARRLGLKIKKCQLSITGLGKEPVHSVKGITWGKIESSQNKQDAFELPLIVLDQITGEIPNKAVPEAVRKHFDHLPLADENFDVPRRVDLLLGVECFENIYNGNKFSPGNQLPCALSSIFGWVITGKWRHPNSPNTPEKVTSLVAETVHLEGLVQRFWESEEPPQAQIKEPEAEICEQLYQKYAYRDASGRYVVPLLIKTQTFELGNSRQQAVNRFLTIEKKLQKNTDLKQQYVEFMKEYSRLGHMSAWSMRDTENKYFIPHHAICRPESTTTKLRVVFDASCKSSNGRSLNDIVYTGPKLQTDIIDLLTKFRLHKIVFTSDISKMYRQILIRTEDRHFQHIIWRSKVNEPLQHFQLNTVTYGISSSPYLAIRTLQQLAQDYEAEFPKAAHIIRNDIFMDDIVSGADSLGEAMQIKNDLITLLGKGKFELRKWSSNTPEFLSDIPVDHYQQPKLFTDPNNELILKILGVKWEPQTDQFTYSITENMPIQYTKRNILSTVAKIFDPLGWVSPVVFSAKILLQDIWRRRLGWDDQIPPDLAENWRQITMTLKELEQIVLPRLIIPKETVETHLVGFCDGSSLGYGCCIYLCAVTPQKTVTNLLIGKSKVAPLRPLTTNRLELCSAVLLSRVLHHMHQLLKPKLVISSVSAYTDSSTVLAWIHTPPYKLKTFVANRIVQITDVIKPQDWYHVKTTENPADCCSRGTTGDKLREHPLWWQGPSWLMDHPRSWPKSFPSPNINDIPEIKTTSQSFLITQGQNPLILDLLEKYSSLSKLKRILAWCVRFGKRTRRLHNNTQGSSLTVAELQEALNLLIKATQTHYFGAELQLLENQNRFSKELQKLNPFIDPLGILRVGGRLSNANLSYTHKYPILLPKSSTLSRLIVSECHKQYLHCGPRTLVSLVSRRFWIVGCRMLARSILAHCMQCFKAQPQTQAPKMADLPAYRVQPVRCFTNIGLDFGGPFDIKESRRRNARIYKGWLCIFICLSTKAIHLELVTELSTEAFIAALDRFVSRRGICSKIISDNGTNFVGANRYLKEAFTLLQNKRSELADCLTHRNITWEFNPPSAPHFGGIFESGIKSTKYHLKRVIGSQILTFEEMYTILTKIEAILNSRPLCASSTDPAETDILTPAHFLIGAPLVALPEDPNLKEIKCPRSRWSLLRAMTQRFWELWSKTYLLTLQQRQKWTAQSKNLKVGELVLVADSGLPPLSWIRGRIEEIHPGKDGVVRVASVRIAQGKIIKRPSVKLCPLPM